MEPEHRLYTLGDLLEDLHQHAMEEWKGDVAMSDTWRAARERRLDAVDVDLRYKTSGVAWVYITIKGKRKAWDREYAYKCWLRPGQTFQLAEIV
jgi:hypothetical protein